MSVVIKTFIEEEETYYKITYQKIDALKIRVFACDAIYTGTPLNISGFGVLVTKKFSTPVNLLVESCDENATIEFV